jgi:hypothetical protein
MLRLSMKNIKPNFGLGGGFLFNKPVKIDASLAVLIIESPGNNLRRVVSCPTTDLPFLQWMSAEMRAVTRHATGFRRP